MKRLALVMSVTVLGAALAGPAEAQEGFLVPGCELSTSHFLVNGGMVYLMGAAEEQDPVRQQRLMSDAYRNFVDALSREQEDNPAVWYLMGRYYVMMEDLAGADSTFDRAEELEPACANDIQYYRQVLWVPTMNSALDSIRQGSYDGAKGLLHAANMIFDQDNLASYYLARIFADEGQTDSAFVYFKRVVDIGNADTARTANYLESLRLIGVLYSIEEQWDSAAVWYERNRQVAGDDPSTLVGLAKAYSEIGQMEHALALYDTVLASAEDMEIMDLFRAGEALFVADQFAMAARAFEVGTAKNPFFRPGLYNLANAYFAMWEDTTRTQEERLASARQMEAVARRLVALDPYNEESLRLLATAFRFQRIDDSTLAVLERIEALPFQVVIDFQQPIEGGYSVQGRVTNAKDQAVHVPDIVFEFVDAAGNGITRDTVGAMTLEPHGSRSFQLTGVGADIAAVRYRVGG